MHEGRTAPVVLNRHHFKRGDEIPKPWIYIGRGSAFGNPFLVDDNRRSGAYDKYRKYLWDLMSVQRAERGRIDLFDQITAETNLVCSCKPAACHGDILVKAWCWLKTFGSTDEIDMTTPPTWVTEPLSSLGLSENGDLFDV